MCTVLFPTITHYTCIQLHNEENGTLATHQFCSYCLSFFYYPPRVCVRACVCACTRVCVSVQPVLCNLTTYVDLCISHHTQYT